MDREGQGHGKPASEGSGKSAAHSRSRRGRLIVVSNRVALPDAAQHAGGLGQAMHSALAEIGGVWFGWSGQVVDDPLVHVQREGAIRFVTRDLDPAGHRDYYLGYANRVLWPLLHGRLDLLAFERRELEGYLRVNSEFADAIRRLARPNDLVWIHDYHLIPLARMLRERGVSSRIGFFLHVPVPPVQTLMALPAHREVLSALASCDVVGVQTEEDAHNLREYFHRLRAAPREIALPPRIEAFPIGIDTEAIAAAAAWGSRSPGIQKLRASLADRALLIGVDRLDYSKGLPQRFHAYERLLERHPGLVGRVTFLQIAPQTRCGVPEYRQLDDQLQQLTGNINGRYAGPSWTPIRYLNRSFAQSELVAYYRAAKVGLVTPLRDGMNLVAKEYVAAQNPEDPGVLVLSEFAGAARELVAGALLVNPYDAEQCADAIHTALAMPLAERRQRWVASMAALRRHDIHAWRAEFLEALSDSQAAREAAAAGDDGGEDAGSIRASGRTLLPAISVSPTASQFIPAPVSAPAS